MTLKIYGAFLVVVAVIGILFLVFYESEYDENMRYCKEKGFSESICVKVIDVYNQYNPDAKIIK